MLRHPRPDSSRTEIRRLAGRLSALVGNLAYMLDDSPAAHVHLRTAHKLGQTVGDRWLVGWSLDAQAMVANSQGHHTDARGMAEQALDYADTPLRRAQLLAWGQLRSLAHLGDHAEARQVMAAAQNEMAADPDGEQPGRFGFDRAELQLHLAEAALQLNDHTLARDHAATSRNTLPQGRPGWAAATLVLARAETARGHLGDATALAHEVLDTIAPAALRQTSRTRLRDLDADLFRHRDLGPHGDQLRERLRTLPALTPVSPSDEPNGLTS